MKNIFRLALILLLAFVFTACTAGIQTVEVTRLVPQTVEITKIVPQTVIVTQLVQRTATIIPKTPMPVEIRTEPDQNTAYYDGIIVLAQYYTLLDHGLYEEVLPLYSLSLLKRSGGGNFESDLKSVKVRFIHPYNYWRAQQGMSPQSIPHDEIRYVVGTIVFHKEAAWNEGGTPMPDEQTRFVSLVLENGDWKLNEYNSSPWFQ